MNENDAIFGASDERLRQDLERLFNSEEYRILSRQLSQNNATFAELPEKVKLTTLYLNHLGLDSALGELWRLLYYRKPPSMLEFLDPVHGGSFAHDLYSGWKEVITRDFQQFQSPQEIVFTGAIGLGKCAAYGEKILRYDGSYVEAQDVQVGDQLRGPDNVPRTVLRVGKGRGKLYRVTTKKGGSFVVNGHHQLVLKKLVRTYEKGKTHATRVASFHHETVQMSVLDLLKKSPQQIKNQYKLFKSPVNYAAKEHVLDPYFIGLMLGDGSIFSQITLYSADPEPQQWFCQYAKHNGYTVTSNPHNGCNRLTVDNPSKFGWMQELARLGVKRSNYNNKSVPAEYKFDSRENRLRLLAGLIDTDGYYNPDGVFEFSSKSEQLARDVYEIALDLGFAAILRYKPTNSQYIRSSPGWRVSISGDLDSIPTLIERKKAKPRTIKKNVLHHGIKSIEELPEGDFYGFEVDGDHLYLDDDRFVHHNTSVAAFLHKWNLLRVLLLRAPQSTLGVAFNTLLVLALFTVTLDKASLALIKPFITLLADSPWFVEVNKAKEFQDFNHEQQIPYVVRPDRVEFPRNIIINIGSTVSHAISYSMFGAMLDEAEFRGSVEDSFQVYTNLKERIRSRFLGSRYTLLTLMSSARYSTGIIADYVRSIEPDDPLTKLYSFAIWDIKNFESYRSKPWFDVLRGTSNHPHRILSPEESALYKKGLWAPPEGCEIISVPEVYRSDFSGARIAEALQNLAGVPVLFTSTYPFTDLSRLEHPKLCPEAHLTAELGSGMPLLEQLPEQVFQTVFDQRRFRVSPNASRAIHFDLAETTEAGVVCSHLSVDKAGNYCVVADFVLKVTSSTRIDLGLLRDLALDIAKLCDLHLVTADQYQSSLFRQEIQLSGLVEKVELVSVDRTVEPYFTVARLVQAGRLLTGPCPSLKNQLTNIAVDNSRSAKKVQGSSEYRKDVADALVGSAYSLLSNAMDLSLGTLAEWQEEKPVQVSGGFDNMTPL